MSKTQWMVLLMVAAVGVVGCSDSREKVMEDRIDNMKETLGVLEGVTDKESADEARPELEELHREEEKIKGRTMILGDPTKEEGKELDEEYGEQVKELGRKLKKEAMRVNANPETASVLSVLRSDDENAHFCRSNQKAIYGASSVYRLKGDKKPTALSDLTTPNANNRNRAYLPNTPVCPEGGTYSVPTGRCDLPSHN